MYNRWKQEKGQKKKENPLELTEEDRRYMDNIIIGGQEDKKRARDIFDNHQTEGTERQYRRVIKELENSAKVQKDCHTTVLGKER